MSFLGNELGVLNSGGVGDHIQWTVRAEDAAGNEAEMSCEVDVVRRQRN